jgi:hypothetical protein
LTVESDIECQQICEKYQNVRCLVFDDSLIKKNGKSFNKGALINEGLKYLDSINYTDWLLFTDSDILFPDTMKQMVEKLEKKKRVLYSLDRYDCETYDVYKQYMETKDMTLLGEKYYVPFAGYCQLFVYEPTKFNLVETHDADRCDFIFLRNFGRPRLTKQRKLCLPGSFESHPFKFLSESEFVIHLGIQDVNHFGRTAENYFDE